MTEIENPESTYVPLAHILQEQIAANPGAEFIGEIQEKNTLGRPGTLEMLVAPASPLYDPDQLNEFMDGLVNSEPSKRFPAAISGSNKGRVVLGKLCFDEVVGRRNISTTTHVEAIDRQLLEELGISEGVVSEESVANISKRIWLRVYPSAQLARTVLSYETERADGHGHPRDPEMSQLAYSFSPEQVKAMENGRSHVYRLKEGLARFLNGGHSH